MANTQPLRIDKSQFEQLLGLMCSMREVAAFFHCSPNGLKAWVRATYDKSYDQVAVEYQSMGRVQLRQNLLKMSAKNPAAAIFLSKNWLGYSDEPKAIDTGEEQKMFLQAIRMGAKAVASYNVGDMAEIPTGEEQLDG